MSREIKFRAWNNRIKEMFPLCPNEWNLGCLNQNEDFWFVMQYTGLKDKNGKEIYEGDIIDFGRDGICEIKCQNLPYEFVAMHPKYNRYSGYWEKGEIIGNVWENKELLNEAQNSESN